GLPDVVSEHRDAGFSIHLGTGEGAAFRDLQAADREVVRRRAEDVGQGVLVSVDHADPAVPVLRGHRREEAALLPEQLRVFQAETLAAVTALADAADLRFFRPDVEAVRAELPDGLL